MGPRGSHTLKNGAKISVFFFQVVCMLLYNPLFGSLSICWSVRLLVHPFISLSVVLFLGDTVFWHLQVILIALLLPKQLRKGFLKGRSNLIDIINLFVHPVDETVMPFLTAQNKKPT